MCADQCEFTFLYLAIWVNNHIPPLVDVAEMKSLHSLLFRFATNGGNFAQKSCNKWSYPWFYLCIFWILQFQSWVEPLHHTHSYGFPFSHITFFRRDWKPLIGEFWNRDPLLIIFLRSFLRILDFLAYWALGFVLY